MQPAPSSQGHREGAPVLASVAGETETAADAPPLAEFELDAPDGFVDEAPLPPPGLFDVAAVLLAGVTRNGAENRWGLEKSS